jgi:1,4-dihydroxy-6-naphthoate synthase
MPTLTLAHSADADDVFMWWPITGKVSASAPHGVIAPACIDTRGWTFRALPADIQDLNKRAIETGDLDITAVSFSTYPHIRTRYALTSCGSSFGKGYGPKLVAKPSRAFASPADLQGLRIAVPGLNTSAYLTLSALVGARRFTPVPTPFDRIIERVMSDEVDAGVVIHEGQLMFARAGLTLVADLGAWWTQQRGMPLPLGANAVRRDLDERFGPGSLRTVVGLLRASIDYAMAHRDEALEYAGTFSPLKERAELDRYVSMYVNDLTVEAGSAGASAVRALLAEGEANGVLPEVGVFEFVSPEVGK